MYNMQWDIIVIDHPFCCYHGKFIMRNIKIRLKDELFLWGKTEKVNQKWSAFAVSEEDVPHNFKNSHELVVTKHSVIDIYLSSQQPSTYIKIYRKVRTYIYLLKMSIICKKKWFDAK
jgi:hypothetical protein